MSFGLHNELTYFCLLQFNEGGQENEEEAEEDEVQQESEEEMEKV